MIQGVQRLTSASASTSTSIMGDFAPKVSIIIPVFNGANYMREAIDSALAQTYKNTEVIVMNDGSSDNTEEIALSYGNKIRYFCKDNGGQSSALNYGIEKMSGDYFSWLSHDDVYFTNKIEAQIQFLSDYPNRDIIILYSDYEVINHVSSKICDVIIPDFEPELFRYMLLVSSPINGCTALVPRKAFLEVGLFDIKKPHTSDVELFFNMAAKYTFVHIQQILIKSRSHDEQMTHKRANYHRFESNLFLIYGLENITKAELIKAARGHPQVFLFIAKNWASRGYKKASISALNLYLSAEGSHIQYFIFFVACQIALAKKKIKTNLKHLIDRI